MWLIYSVAERSITSAKKGGSIMNYKVDNATPPDRRTMLGRSMVNVDDAHLGQYDTQHALRGIIRVRGVVQISYCTIISTFPEVSANEYRRWHTFACRRVNIVSSSQYSPVARVQYVLVRQHLEYRLHHTALTNLRRHVRTCQYVLQCIITHMIDGPIMLCGRYVSRIG